MLSKLTPILELRSLSKAFPTHRAVDQISLAVAPGSFFSLVGPSGCGKTTTLRLIAGFETPSEGEILLSGEPVHHRKPYQRNVSTVFQNYALFPHLTVEQNIQFGLREHKIADPKPLVDAALETVQLHGKHKRYPAQLSGGERQRVALARSLVLKPDVLLLDEPLAALDPQLRKEMRHQLKDLQRNAGIAFLFVTHDQEEALSLSDRLAVMNKGRVEQEGTPAEIYERPCTRFVAGFLGAVNWLGSIGIRPEAVRLQRHLPEKNGASGRSATVLRSVYLGHTVHVFTREAEGREVVAALPHGSESFLPGDSVHLCWNPEDEIRLAE